MLYSRTGCSRAGSKGPATLPHLSGELFAVLEQEPAKGPAAHGWPDQKWTLDGGMTAAAPDAWLAFEDEARFSMAPAKARTWSRRRITPVICIRGRSRRHISIAALVGHAAGRGKFETHWSRCWLRYWSHWPPSRPGKTEKPQLSWGFV
ncbi:hypothetical protein ACMATS_08475 [Streptoverticillium reticulum]|uniref:hypothetical protein n=1 Tax=Streptoverticillium reticulum TaxID=1433415 RepID=UPI0039BEF41B